MGWNHTIIAIQQPIRIENPSLLEDINVLKPAQLKHHKQGQNNGSNIFFRSKHEQALNFALDGAQHFPRGKRYFYEENVKL